MDKYMEYLNTFESNIDDTIEKILAWMQVEFQKTYADGVILEMSGGLDCSVVAVLARMAGIPVQLITMPRDNSMQYGQMEDALRLAVKFDLPINKVPIGEMSALVQETCEHVKKFWERKGMTYHGDVAMANANIGPMQRMLILSTLGQYMNYVMIGTGNLTERYIGNFTKRGDGQSDFNPIGNLTKSEIRIIAKHIGIPDTIIQKAPSADLWPGQTDEEEMGLRIEDIDRYLLTGEGDDEIIEKIEGRHQRNLHKLTPIPMMPRAFSSLIEQPNKKRA